MTVAKELHNLNWVGNLKQINNEQLMDEFILLFTTLNEVQLNYQRDTILWKWTKSDEYSAASAYDA
jgi:hypothetical protein